jgi:hypothetical protein
MIKLTPVGSQNEYFHEERVQDIEVEIFDTNLGKVPDTVHPDVRQWTIIDSDEEVVETNIPTLVNTNVNSSKNSHTPDDPETQPTKRRFQKNKVISTADREESKNQIWEILRLLSPPEDIPDLLRRSADRLENNLFNKVSKERPVNVLGRSSTLVTAGNRDSLGKYLKEKKTLLSNVKAYVETATKEGVEIDQVQKGEIWQVIRGVIESNP